MNDPDLLPRQRILARVHLISGAFLAHRTDLAKLFAEQLLDVPRMLHFAVYAQTYQVVAAAGDSRPDLIGLSKNGQWFVFEAKGRSNNFDAEALKTAKAQAEQIQFIDNLAPVCNIGCQVYFTNVLNFRLDDPPAGGGRRVRTIKITRSEFEHANNEPIRTVIDLRGANAPLSLLSDSGDYFANQFVGNG